jgi:hypothetical protein
MGVYAGWNAVQLMNLIVKGYYRGLSASATIRKLIALDSNQDAGFGPVVVAAGAVHLVASDGQTDYAAFLLFDVTVVP